MILSTFLPFRGHNPHPFPKEKHNVALTLLKAATRLEKSSPEGCIALQRRALALMALELKQARYAAYAAEKALTTALETDVI